MCKNAHAYMLLDRTFMDGSKVTLALFTKNFEVLL